MLDETADSELNLQKNDRITGFNSAELLPQALYTTAMSQAETENFTMRTAGAIVPSLTDSACQLSAQQGDGAIRGVSELCQHPALLFHRSGTHRAQRRTAFITMTNMHQEAVAR